MQLHILVAIFRILLLSTLQCSNASVKMDGPVPEASSDLARRQIRFPAEGEPHLRTYMCWPGSAEIWTRKLLKLVQYDIASIAEAIVQFEPVTMIVSRRDFATAREMLSSKVDLLQIPVDDLWARDTLPVFTIQDRSIVAVDLNFNGWGLKQTHAHDSELARTVSQTLKIRREISGIVSEAGALETDGSGTLLVTESSLIHKKRNPKKSKPEIELELKRSLGIQKVIWFQGVQGKDITDAHVDCLVRFVRPGRVIVTRPCRDCVDSEEDYVWARASAQALEVLRRERDARGQKFEIVDLVEPHPDKVKVVGDPSTFVASYVNFYVINGAVIMPKFGDASADEEAQRVMQREFPGRKIVAVEISALASGGGGIHCATHDLPELAQ